MYSFFLTVLLTDWLVVRLYVFLFLSSYLVYLVLLIDFIKVI